MLKLIDRLVAKNVVYLGALAAMWLILLVFVIKANLDVSVHRFPLFVDEMLTLDQVYDILRAKDLADWWFKVADGNFLRYGRVMIYLNALVAYPFDWIFGEQGQILATRFFQAAVLFSAFVVLVESLLEDRFVKLMAYCFLLFQPFTVYYATMPKPEPEQLLAYALFFSLVHRNGAIKPYYWVFIGLALGTKASALPLTVFLFGYFKLKIWSEEGFAMVFKKAWIGFAWLILGYAIAVPSAGVAILTLDIAWFKKLIAEINKEIVLYGERRDNSFFTWINHFFYRWSHIPWYIVMLITALCTYISAMVYMIVKPRVFDLRQWMPILIILCGLAISLPIALKIKRMWGFYLHIPVILIFIGFLMLFERWLAEYRSLPKKISTAVLVLFLLIFGVSQVFAARQSYYNGKKLWTRSVTLYPKHLRDYYKVLYQLDRLYALNGKKLKVHIEGELFWPKSNGRYFIDPWYLPFDKWADDYDVLFLHNTGLYHSIHHYAPKFVGMNYTIQEKWYEAIKLYPKHCTYPGNVATEEPKYVMMPINNSHFFLLVKPNIKY